MFSRPLLGQAISALMTGLLLFANPTVHADGLEDAAGATLTIRKGTFYRGDKPVLLIGPLRMPANEQEYQRIKNMGFNLIGMTLWKYTQADLERASRYGFKVSVLASGHTALRDKEALAVLKQHPRKLPAELWHGFMMWENPNVIVDHPQVMAALDTWMGKQAHKLKNDLAMISSMVLWNEPGYVDYGPMSRSRFIRSLMQRYGSIDRLNQHWTTDYSSFDAIEIPIPKRVKSEAGDRLHYGDEPLPLIVSWERFGIQRQADFLGWWRDVIMQQTGSHVPMSVKKLALMIMPTMGKYASGNIPIMLACEDIAGHDNEFAKFDEQGSLIDIARYSFQLDYLRANAMGRPLSNSEYHRPDHSKLKGQDRENLLQLSMLMPFLHGLAECQLWKWDSGETKRRVGLDDPFLFPPDERIVGQTVSTLPLLAPYLAPLDFHAPTAILMSESSVLVEAKDSVAGKDLLGGKHLGRAWQYYQAMIFNGQRVDVLSEEALARFPELIERYQTVICPATHAVMPKVTDRIRQWVESGGLLVTDQQSFHADDLGIRTGQLAWLESGQQGRGWIDIQSQTDDLNQLRNALVQVQKKTNRQIPLTVSHIDGTLAVGVESGLIDHGDRGVLYLINYQAKPVPVRLAYHGKSWQRIEQLASANRLDLEQSTQITLQPYQCQVYLLDR